MFPWLAFISAGNDRGVNKRLPRIHNKVIRLAVPHHKRHPHSLSDKFRLPNLPQLLRSKFFP